MAKPVLDLVDIGGSSPQQPTAQPTQLPTTPSISKTPAGLDLVDLNPDGSAPAGSAWESQPEYIKKAWQEKSPWVKNVEAFGANLHYQLAKGITGVAQALQTTAQNSSPLGPFENGPAISTWSVPPWRAKQMADNLPKFDNEEFAAKMPPEAAHSVGATTGKVLGVVAPAVATGMAAPSAATASGRIAINTLLGAAQGGAEYVDPNAPKGTRGQNAAFSGVMSAGISGIAEIMFSRVGRALNMFRQAADPLGLDNAPTSWAPMSEQLKLAKRADEIAKQHNAEMSSLESKGWPMGLEQRLAGPVAEHLAGKARSYDPAKATLWDNAQLLKAKDEFVNLMASVEHPQAGVLTEANKGQKLLGSVGSLLDSKLPGSMAYVRNANWEKNLSAAVDATGGAHVMPVAPALERLNSYVDNIEDFVPANAAPGQKAVLTRFGSKLKALAYGDSPVYPKLAAEQGKITADQYAKLMVEINGNITAAKDPTTKAGLIQAKSILQSALKDISAQELDSVSKKGAEALIKLRNDYKTDSDLIAFTVSAPLRKFLRSNNPVAGEAVLQAFDKTPPATLQAFMNTLDEQAPGTATLLRNRALQSAYAEAEKVGAVKSAGGQVEFNVDALIKKLPSGEKLDALFGGIPTTRDSLKEYIRAADRLGFLPKASAVGSAEEARQAAARMVGNVATTAAQGKYPISQIPWYLGWVSKYGSGPVVMQYLQTTEGRAALMAADKAHQKWFAATKMAGPAALRLLHESSVEQADAYSKLAGIAAAYTMSEGSPEKNKGEQK